MTKSEASWGLDWPVVGRLDVAMVIAEGGSGTTLSARPIRLAGQLIKKGRTYRLAKYCTCRLIVMEQTYRQASGRAHKNPVLVYLCIAELCRNASGPWLHGLNTIRFGRTVVRCTE
jgi:hypothetical protein